jgi:putative peptidoglycan lipid II flippase
VDDAPVVPHPHAPAVEAALRLDDPLASVDAVLGAVRRLVDRVFADALLRGRAARGARLRALLANGMRQIFLLLIPAAAATLALATPITRLIYQHGHFGTSSTDLVSSALFWFAFSLPFSGVNLLLTRTFFSLQKPWITTGIAGLNLTVNVGVSVALYKPLGIPGIVIGTGVSSAAMTLAQMHFLRRELHGRLDTKRTLVVTAQITAASALLAGVSYGTWYVLDHALGVGLIAQLLSVGLGLAVGIAVYAATVLILRIPEARQIEDLIVGRLRRSAGR